MQETACRNFATEKGWEIVIEESELGVSAFKKTAEERDKLQNLIKAASDGKFDILLVFMFDRLGRRDYETPLVVQGFVEMGVAVWSVMEGEKRFDNHTDSLTNFITFWQAAGESKKISMRVREAMQQNLEQGIYSGGVTPFGYERVKKGRKNKSGEEVFDLTVKEDEAVIVRMLFNKTVREGYGCHRLAELVNAKGVKTHRGNKFTFLTVAKILHNRIFTGHYSIGEKLSPKVKELEIIDEDTFVQAQYILAQRALTNNANRTISRNTVGQTLLSGNVFCRACGKRICSTTKQQKYKLKNGDEKCKLYAIYRCFYQNGEKCNCSGQKTYIAERVDSAVISSLHEMFKMIKDKPQTVAVETKLKAQEQRLKKQRRVCETELNKNSKDLETLKAEIPKSIRGESIFTQSDLADEIGRAKTKIAESESRLSEIDTELKRQSHSISMVGKMYSDFIGWADEFNHASLEEKKMITCRLIKRVELERGYRVHITLNMDYEQFCDEWGIGLGETFTEAMS
jgi:DNA invertase Pin-like site-specific DNA recombinase